MSELAHVACCWLMDSMLADTGVNKSAKKTRAFFISKKKA